MLATHAPLLLLACILTLHVAGAQFHPPPPAIHAKSTDGAAADATVDRSPACADTRPECEAWAARGECVTNA